MFRLVQFPLWVGILLSLSLFSCNESESLAPAPAGSGPGLNQFNGDSQKNNSFNGDLNQTVPPVNQNTFGSTDSDDGEENKGDADKIEKENLEGKIRFNLTYPKKESANWKIILIFDGKRNEVTPGTNDKVEIEIPKTGKTIGVDLRIMQDGVEYDATDSSCAVAKKQSDTEIYVGFDSECDEDNAQGTSGWQDTDDLIIKFSIESNDVKVNLSGITTNSSINLGSWF